MNHIVESQEAVLRFLGDPATHGGGKVRRIDTHAAAVFLAGTRALKVKRAVRFPFLDYSTLAQRKAACAAELAVNRPFAPALYRGVIAIARGEDGSLSLGGSGEPVEWAVDMRRFDENATLDHLADAGAIDVALADRLGRLVAAMQKIEAVAEGGPWIEALGVYIGQNEQEFREHADLFASPAVERLTRASRALLARLRPLLTRRSDLGLVLRGHGDLHLGNIAMIDGEPMAFDAIEFDPLIATGDVLYELSFLLMDLVERDLQPAANIVLNRYLSETRRDADLDGLAALPLFLSLRAGVRAKVTAARAANADRAAQGAINDAARRYFDFALRFIAPPAPRLVAVGGLSGTGKSVLARALAADLPPAPGAAVFRSDVERKAMFGLAETAKLPQDAYMPDVTQKLYAALGEKARRTIAAGHSAIVDAVFATPQERKAMASIAQSCGVHFQGLFLTADLTTRLARVGIRAGDASDANADIVRQQEHYNLGPVDWVCVDAGHSPDVTLANARAVLT